MHTYRLNNNAILVFILALVAAFIFLVVKFYQVALRDAQAYHQKQQLEMARSAAVGVSYYLQALGEDIVIQSRLASETFPDTLPASQVQRGALLARFNLDRSFQPLGKAGTTVPVWVIREIRRAESNEQNAIRGPGRDGKVWFSSVFPMDTTAIDPVLVLIAVWKSGGDGDAGGIAYSGALISFDWITETFISPLHLGEDDFAWVLDGDGRLIYHPAHEEMLLHSTWKTEEDCLECHDSFDVQKRMTREGLGTAEYHIRGEPRKIMGYAPIQLSNQRWILAISTYLPAVIRGVLRGSFSIFILSGAFLILLILTGITLYYLNVRRIRADESQKHLARVNRIQEKLDQATKLASIGELVDSVAHEINTPTGIIAALADNLLLEGTLPDEQIQDLDVIKKQILRIKRYTKSLLGYSRMLPFTPEMNDLLPLLDESLFLVSPRVRKKQIRVDARLPESWPRFVFDRPRIEQVIINLLNNAIDVVDMGGQITVTLESRPAGEDPEGESWTILSISDDGPGIDPARQERIFDPFFSTKPRDQGTGLGLSISRSIIARHGGRLQLESVPGDGATFSIHLPERRS